MSMLSQFAGAGIKSIQRGVINVNGGAGIATVTISAVNTAKTELRYLGSQSDQPGRIVLTNSTTITVTTTSQSTSSFSWELTEFY